MISPVLRLKYLDRKDLPADDHAVKTCMTVFCLYQTLAVKSVNSRIISLHYSMRVESMLGIGLPPGTVTLNFFTSYQPMTGPAGSLFLYYVPAVEKAPVLSLYARTWPD